MDKTVIKAIGLFEQLAASPTPMGISELAALTKLQRSNVHRILKTFVALGYVRQRPDQLYEATLRVWEMGTRIIERIDVRSVARAELVALVKESGESVHLSRLEALEVLYLDKIDSDNPVRAYTQIGGRAPAYCTATGKVLLAHDAETAAAVAARGLVKHTPRTITHATALRRELAGIREQGFSINSGEWREHVAGLAAPVFDHRGELVAAIGISGPIERLKPKVLRSFAPAVMAAAARTSRALGFSGAQEQEGKGARPAPKKISSGGANATVGRH